MKTNILFRLILFTLIFYYLSGCQDKRPKEKVQDLASINVKPYPNSRTDPDKTVLIGEWSMTGTPNEIKITGVLDNGKLEVSYFDPKYINIIKANWLKNSTLLSIYIELEDIGYQGSNFKLNYVPGRDVLVGDFFDASENITYSVEFIRIK